MYFFTANLTKLFEIKTNSIEVAHCIYVFFYRQPHKVVCDGKQILLK